MTETLTAKGLWTARVLTLFPEMFPGPLSQSVVGRALAAGIWQLEVVNMRDFATDAHRTVDDTPYGGGPGMVLRADIVNAALESTCPEAARRAVTPVEMARDERSRLVYLTPRGRPLNQAMAASLATAQHVTLLCGHYEGIDQRVIDHWQPEEISLGDFVLSGGELASMAVIDTVARLLPGVVGSQASLREESFENALLEYPQFTRPQSWIGRDVPEVLLSGHHQRIQAWRQRQSEDLTRQRRPDLWAHYCQKISQQQIT